MSTPRPRSASASPRAMIASLWEHRNLTATLTRREIAARYRGSMFGLIWAIATPLLVLAVYSYVFTEIFERTLDKDEGPFDFPLKLFAGLIVYNLFVECINRAPVVVLANANYVKKVVFPLQVLPIVGMGFGLFHLATSIMIWLIFFVVTEEDAPHLTVLLLPVILAPFAVITTGISWFLASLGVFLRDVGQFVGVALLMLMFLSPIFYELETIKDPVALSLMHLNPITIAIEHTRDVMWYGNPPDWTQWAIFAGASTIVSWLGYAFFQKTRGGFADVI